MVNILDSIKKQMNVSTIASVRAGNKGDIFCVEGIVTAGTVSGNAFFDTIYIEDPTGGINIFPINQGLIEVGQRVKVIGYLDEYLGDKELRVIQATVTDTTKNPLSPTTVTTKEAMDYATNGGKLVKVTGVITNVIQKNGVIETIKVKDSSGVEARIFIDGYINYSDATSTKLEGIALVGNTISAVGLVSYDTEGQRLRVRDRSEIVLVSTGNTNNNGSNDTTNGTNDTTNGTNTTTNDKEKNTFEQISIPAKKTIYIGKSYKLTVQLPIEVEHATITYSSSNKAIASISKDGKITPKKAGTITITTKITINGVTKVFKTKVTVKKPYVSLTAKTTSIKVGETFIFKAKAYGVTGTITWESSNKSIATISKSGKLVAKKAGKVTIKVKVNNVTKTIVVTVKSK